MLKTDYNMDEDKVIQPWYKVLYVQVLIAIVLGILIGHFYPKFGVSLEQIGRAHV